MIILRDKILELLNEKPKHAVKMIVKWQELWNWVLLNCDLNCIDNKTKIYTAVTNEKILCPCGSGKLRNLISFKEGLSFCGRANACASARKAVSEGCIAAAKLCNKKDAKQKRAETNLKLYGHVNAGQSKKAKENHKIFYQNSKNVKSAIEAWQTTNLKNRGVDNPQKDSIIRQKTINTNQKLYGTPHPSQNQDVKNATADYFREKYDGASCPFAFKPIQEQIKLIHNENLKVDYPFQSEDVRNKSKETCQKSYGVDHSSQKHYSMLAKEILFDPIKFEKMVLELGFKQTAEKLKVWATSLYKYSHLYNLNLIQNHSSSYELELVNWLTQHQIQCEMNRRDIIAPYELDIYLPEFKLAIEFNGLYWHSENFKSKNYHLNKTQKCEEKGIRLVHIFEDEWLQKRSTCLDLISRFLGLNQVKIMARKCEIKEISNKEGKKLFENNHLQGNAFATVNIGLFYENDLIQVMTFRHPRYNKNVEWENIRCNNKFGYQVVGGVQKLWSYFLKTYHPITVVSYCDKRWFTGETYKKLGFELSHTTPPQYHYTDFENRWHRSVFIKRKCVAKAKLLGYLDTELKGLSERQMAKEILDLARIWDCGHGAWIWKR